MGVGWACGGVCKYKWQSAVHLNLPSTTPLPIALPHVHVSNTLRPRWCIETHAVVLLRKAGHKWIVIRYILAFLEYTTLFSLQLITAPRSQ